MPLWTLQLLPIAFVFRIRANHEYPLLAGVVVAVYGIERSGSDGPGCCSPSQGFCTPCW